VLGHEGAGAVVEVGPGVTQREAGRPRDPAYTPEWPQCKKLSQPQDQPLHGDPRDPGQGPDARWTSRFSHKGQAVFHYMGCSTFSNFTVLPEIAVAKIPHRRALPTRPATSAAG